MGIPAANGIDACGQPNALDQANAVVSGIITAVGPQPPFAFRGPMNLNIWASVNTTLTTTKGSLAASVASATGITNGASINSKNVPAGATVEGLSGTNFNIALPPVSYNIFKPYSAVAPGISTQSAQVLLPPGSNVAALLGATVTVPSTAFGITIPAGTIVQQIIQNDVAPSLATQGTPDGGTPGIILLSNAPTAVPSAPGTPDLRLFLQFQPTNNAIPTTGTDAAAIFTGGSTSMTFSATIALEKSYDGGKTWLPCNIPTNSATVIVAQWSAGPVSLTFGEPEKNVLYRLNAQAYTSGTINWRISQTGGAAESLAIGPLSGG